MTSNTIGNRIKAAKRMAGIGTMELQRRMGMTLFEIMRYEDGKDIPDSKTLIQFSKALDVNVEYFLRPFEVDVKLKQVTKKGRDVQRDVTSDSKKV